MKFKIKRKSNGIYLAEFEDLYDMGMTFVRFQEYYECPEFAGRYFTLEEYIDYWSKNKGQGSFNYPVMWHGFNVPGRILSKWVNLFLESNGDIRGKEKMLLNRFGMSLKRDKCNINDCYLIGSLKVVRGRDTVVRHEMAHALYALNEKYKKSCCTLINNVIKKDEKRIVDAKVKLKKMGYCEEVLVDEIQAYWSSSDHTGLLGMDKKFKDNLDRYLSK